MGAFPPLIRCSMLRVIKCHPHLGPSAMLACFPSVPLFPAHPPPFSQGLLAAGARCDAADENGWTALHFAANDGFSEAVQV